MHEHFWLSMAADRGRDWVWPELDKVKATLSAEQLAETARRKSEWTPVETPMTWRCDR